MIFSIMPYSIYSTIEDHGLIAAATHHGDMFGIEWEKAVERIYGRNLYVQLRKRCAESLIDTICLNLEKFGDPAEGDWLQQRLRDQIGLLKPNDPERHIVYAAIERVMDSTRIASERVKNEKHS